MDTAKVGNGNVEDILGFLAAIGAVARYDTVLGENALLLSLLNTVVTS